MSKPRKSDYTRTIFAKRIVELQNKHNYTNQYVVDNVKDSSGKQLIESLQAYQKWKAGERLPHKLQVAIVAFANFYGVSTDHLLIEDAPETPQIQSVQDATGFSTESIKALFEYKQNDPLIVKMIDVIISDSSFAGRAFIINLYNQILSDYRSKIKNERDKSLYDYEQMQARFLKTQKAYAYISSVIMEHLSKELDDQIRIQDENEEKYRSVKYQEIYKELSKEMNNEFESNDVSSNNQTITSATVLSIEQTQKE